MLERLLIELSQGKAVTLDELAQHLETSTALIEQMLGELEKAGYISSVDTQCDQNCSGCSLQGLCSLTQENRIWRVTETGQKAAQAWAERLSAKDSN